MGDTNTMSGSTTRLDRPSSHLAPPNGVNKRDASLKRRSGYDTQDADTRSVASSATSRPKHKGPPPDGYRKKDGSTKRRSRVEETRPIELSDIKMNGETAATSSVKMRQNGRKSATAARMRSYGDVNYRKSGYNVWTDGGKQRASVKFTRDLHKKGRKKWQELRHVTELTIDDEDHVYSAMPSQLCELTDLKTLRFTLSGATSLPSRFGSLRLRHLTLRENSLHNVDALVKMTSLTTLDLSFNELHMLPSQIGALSKLTTLNVGKNKLTSLPSSIGYLSELHELSMNANKLTKLPDSIGALRKLNSLDVGDNQIVSLPATIGKLGNVTELRASHNQLSTLPASIVDMMSLQFLFLARNKFAEVPPMLQNITSLDAVNMNQNHVADMTRPIPSVRSLMLDDNQLDKFPDAILACESLEILSLQKNKIRVIPDDILRLRNLHSLFLESNELSEVPESLCHMAKPKSSGVEQHERTATAEVVQLARCRYEAIKSDSADDKTKHNDTLLDEMSSWQGKSVLSCPRRTKKKAPVLNVVNSSCELVACRTLWPLETVSELLS
ncbi:hypothetical protein LSAT2_022935 [Lamellibrachia satsuma]|nr:hypothetical protein LSAT2_022935 [Lamellibrachia satsuma]